MATKKVNKKTTKKNIEKGKKWSKYNTLNTIIFFILLLLMNIVYLEYNAYYVGSAATEVELYNKTEEEIKEEFKEDKDFTKIYDGIKESIEESKEELTKLEENSEDYKKKELEINHAENSIVRLSLYNMYIKKFSSYAIQGAVIIDLFAMLLYFLITMAILKNTRL